jgi:hypothetical protein
VNKRSLIIVSSMLAVGGGSLAVMPSAYAFDMGNMMNPNKWFDGNKDRYRDDYYYDRYDRYGYGPYGGGWGGPYGYGAPYGYGYPGYGYGVPGYQQQQQSNEPPPPPLPQ